MYTPKSNRNREIRQAIIDAGIHQIEVAEELLISPQTLQNWLRASNCGGHKEDILQAIKAAAGQSVQ